MFLFLSSPHSHFSPPVFFCITDNGTWKKKNKLERNFSQFWWECTKKLCTYRWILRRSSNSLSSMSQIAPGAAVIVPRLFLFFRQLVNLFFLLFYCTFSRNSRSIQKWGKKFGRMPKLVSMNPFYKFFLRFCTKLLWKLVLFFQLLMFTSIITFSK